MSSQPETNLQVADISTRAARQALIGIILLSCGLDLFFFSGYYASDDAAYLQAAWRWTTGRTYGAEPDLAALRLTLVGWNMLIIRLCGYHPQLIAGSYILFHQLTNVFTFILARRMRDNAAAVLAAYCMAVTPLAVTHAAAVLPDLPLTSLMLLSLVLFYMSYGDPGRTGAKSRLLLLGAGACVGLAYAAKETALILVPFFAVLWLTRERKAGLKAAVLRGTALAGGFIMILLVEWALLSLLTGRCYWRMAWTVGPTNFVDTLRDNPYGYYPVERLAYVWEHLGDWFGRTGFVYLFGLAVLVYPFKTGRCRALWALTLWYFAYHVWGSTRLSEYLPPPLQPRYFTPILPLLFIMYAFVIVKAWRSVRNWGVGLKAIRVLTGIVAVALFLQPLPGLRISDRHAGKIYRADLVNTARLAIEAARDAGDRPVLLSKTVDDHIAPLIQTRPPGDVITPRCWKKPETRRRLIETGFYYIEIYPIARLRTVARAGGADPLLHPVIEARSDESLDDPVPQTCFLGHVEIEGSPGSLWRLKRFDLPKRRSAALLGICFPGFRPRPDPNTRSAYLYLWIPLSQDPINDDAGAAR